MKSKWHRSKNIMTCTIMGFVALALHVLYDQKTLAPRPEFDNDDLRDESRCTSHNCCSLVEKLQQFKQSFGKLIQALNTYFKLDSGN